MWIRDRLDDLWSDADFTAWYPRDGRPELSPAQFATVCVLQYAMNLSDRQAAEAVRCRIDFTIRTRTGPGRSRLPPERPVRLPRPTRRRRPRRPATEPRTHPDPTGRPAQGARHAAHRLHPRPVRRTGADPPGAGDRGGPRRAGRGGPRRARGAG
ncbi:transposase [Streptomyces sp. NPDC001027]|uniref:transposase n=1 Tax=Streptomyces sp. NPDC001027 TaxID=3154771 RepID=UPI00332CCCE3